MKVIELNEIEHTGSEIKIGGIYFQLVAILKELTRKDLESYLILKIHLELRPLNSSVLSDSELKKLLKLKQTRILKLVEKEHKIIAKNHYRILLMVLGMSSFGFPIGLASRISMGNIGFMGLGLTIVMFLRLTIGSGLYKKAAKEGRKLDS